MIPWYESNLLAGAVMFIIMIGSALIIVAALSLGIGYLCNLPSDHFLYTDVFDLPKGIKRKIESRRMEKQMKNNAIIREVNKSIDLTFTFE